MHKYTTLQKRLILSAIAAVIVVSLAVIYSLFFLSDNLLHALVPGDGSNTGSAQFNLEAFNSLGL